MPKSGAEFGDPTTLVVTGRTSCSPTGGPLYPSIQCKRSKGKGKEGEISKGIFRNPKASFSKPKEPEDKIRRKKRASQKKSQAVFPYGEDLGKSPTESKLREQKRGKRVGNTDERLDREKREHRGKCKRTVCKHVNASRTVDHVSRQEATRFPEAVGPAVTRRKGAPRTVGPELSKHNGNRKGGKWQRDMGAGGAKGKHPKSGKKGAWGQYITEKMFVENLQLPNSRGNENPKKASRAKEDTGTDGSKCEKAPRNHGEEC